LKWALSKTLATSTLTNKNLSLFKLCDFLYRIWNE